MINDYTKNQQTSCFFCLKIYKNGQFIDVMNWYCTLSILLLHFQLSEFNVVWIDNLNLIFLNQKSDLGRINNWQSSIHTVHTHSNPIFESKTYRSCHCLVKKKIQINVIAKSIELYSPLLHGNQMSLDGKMPSAG